MDEKKGACRATTSPFFSPVAGRRPELIASSNPRLVKKAPIGASVGADPARAARCVFDHGLFGMMVSFYEQRTTNYEPRLFPRNQMRRTAATDSNGQRRLGKPSARGGPPLQDGPYGIAARRCYGLTTNDERRTHRRRR